MTDEFEEELKQLRKRRMDEILKEQRQAPKTQEAQKAEVREVSLNDLINTNEAQIWQKEGEDFVYTIKAYVSANQQIKKGTVKMSQAAYRRFLNNYEVAREALYEKYVTDEKARSRISNLERVNPGVVNVVKEAIMMGIAYDRIKGPVDDKLMQEILSTISEYKHEGKVSRK